MDVAIIGGGPVGALAARYGAERHDVTLYEGRTDRRMQCSGVLSKKGLMSLGIPIKKDLIQNRVRGAKIFSDSEKVMEIDGKHTRAYVFDRRELDNYLLDKALGWNVDFIERHVRPDDFKHVWRANDRVVLATGTNYALHRTLNLQYPKEFLNGAQYEVQVECDSDFVELHFNNPDFFTWVIPVDDYARVGACVKGNPLPYLHKFLKKLGEQGRIDDYHIRDEHYGSIPIHDPSMRTKYGKIHLLGDAAGQVKASTGGGINLAGKAARHVFEDDYEWRWRKEIGNELRTHLAVHRFMSKLSTNERDNLLKTVSEHKHALENEGEMDKAIKSLSALFKRPRFTTKFMRHLPSFFSEMVR